MVGSTSPRSDSLSPAVPDDVPIRMDMHVASGGPRSRHHHAAVLAPRYRNTRKSSSRVPRARARAGPSPSLISNSDPVRPVAAATSSSSSSSSSPPASAANSNRPTSTAGLLPASASGSRPTSSASSVRASSSGSSQPTAVARAPSSGVPVALITCAAVGGVIVVATMLALVYFFRIRRRVKRMKRCTNILGPGALRYLTIAVRLPRSERTHSSLFLLFCLELAPISPGRSSQISFESLAKPNGTHGIASPSTSDPARQFLPLRTPTLTAPTRTSIEQRPREPPRSPLRISTTMVGPPPPARRGSIPFPEPRSPIRSSQHPREPPRSSLRISTTMVGRPPPARRGSIPFPEPRSPIRSSLVTMTWPSPTPRSPHFPGHDPAERGASPD
jgi:hypothetical protein